MASFIAREALRTNINRRVRRANDLQVNIKTLSASPTDRNKQIVGRSKTALKKLRQEHKDSNRIAKEGLVNAKKRLTRFKSRIPSGVSSQRITIAQSQVDAQTERVRIIGNANKRIFGSPTINKKRKTRLVSVTASNKFGV